MRKAGLVAEVRVGGQGGGQDDGRGVRKVMPWWAEKRAKAGRKGCENVGIVCMG